MFPPHEMSPPARRVGFAVGALALLLVLVGPPAGAQGGAGELVDLQPTTSEPTDGASATVVVAASPQGMTVSLSVTGLDRAAAGMMVGSHVHVGPCVAGDGAAAGPHFNATAGSANAKIGPSTEVWLDFTIGADGTGHASSTVPFTIIDQAARSVVIHAMPTDPGGGAGARWACLPVDFSDPEPAGSAGDQEPTALAFTGSDTAQLAVAGGAMVALGGLLVAETNRRRRVG